MSNARIHGGRATRSTPTLCATAGPWWLYKRLLIKNNLPDCEAILRKPPTRTKCKSIWSREPPVITGALEYRTLPRYTLVRNGLELVLTKLLRHYILLSEVREKTKQNKKKPTRSSASDYPSQIHYGYKTITDEQGNI